MGSMRQCANPRIWEVGYAESVQGGRYPESDERRLARNILSVHAESIMEHIPSSVMCERYSCEDAYRKVFPNAKPAYCEALLHWVELIWKRDGMCYFKLSNHFQG